MIEKSEYRGPELRRILEEHSLSKTELAQIMQTDRRHVYRYLKDEHRVPNVRWRVLMLELALQRADWTPTKRRRRWLSQYF